MWTLEKGKWIKALFLTAVSSLYPFRFCRQGSEPRWSPQIDSNFFYKGEMLAAVPVSKLHTYAVVFMLISGLILMLVLPGVVQLKSVVRWTFCIGFSGFAPHRANIGFIPVCYVITVPYFKGLLMSPAIFCCLWQLCVRKRASHIALSLARYQPASVRALGFHSEADVPTLKLFDAKSHYKWKGLWRFHFWPWLESYLAWAARAKSLCWDKAILFAEIR